MLQIIKEPWPKNHFLSKAPILAPNAPVKGKSLLTLFPKIERKFLTLEIIKYKKLFKKYYAPPPKKYAIFFWGKSDKKRTKMDF